MSSTPEIEIDYGLAPGESFEPEDLPDEVPEGLPRIETMLGPIDPGALGVTLFTDSLQGIDGLQEFEPMSVVGELENAYAIGLRSLVITRPVGGEDMSLIRWIASRSPVHILVPDDEDDLHAEIAWASDSVYAPFLIIERPAEAQANRDGLLLGTRTTPGQSLTSTLHRLPLHLLESGWTAAQVRIALVDNPLAALTQDGGTPE